MIEKLNHEKRAWKKEEDRKSTGKDGRLHVHRDQVVHEIKYMSVLRHQRTQIWKYVYECMKTHFTYWFCELSTDVTYEE